MNTPRQLIRDAAARLEAAGVPDPENDAALLLSSVCRRPFLELRLDQETDLDFSDVVRFESLLYRRISREPLQYILGETSFCGLSFRTDYRALIPRPETELLCGWASEILEGRPSGRVLDLCCGTGCIGLVLKKRFPAFSVTLADLSAQALSLAMENAECLECDVKFVSSDLFSRLSGRYDLICSNPPYIPSADCLSLQKEVQQEPVIALDGGEDGLDFYRIIAAEAPAHLVPGGWLLLELGYGEADGVVQLLSSAGFEEIQVRKDDRMIDRMVCARCPDGGQDVSEA